MSAKKTAAIFCFEDPGSAVGRFAADAARLLALSGHPVHMFTRLEMNLAEPPIFFWMQMKTVWVHPFSRLITDIRIRIRSV